MGDRLTVGVVFGGRSGEHEVSLMSARSVLDALDPDKYHAVQIGITHEGEWLYGDDVMSALLAGNRKGTQRAAIVGQPGSSALYRWQDGQVLQLLQQLDIVFPVLHGTFGEDGTLQGLLEMAEIPYVGAGVLASAVGMDKALFKDLMRSHGIPVVESIVLLSTELGDRFQAAMERAEAVAPYPLFTKPSNLGSSVGITKCRNRSDLVEGVMEASRYDRRVLVERGVDAREIEVSVLGNEEPEASVPGEILPSDEFYSYRAKYIDGTSQLLIPAPLDEGTAQEARRLAVEAFKAIDGAGMARVDFLLDRQTGRLYVNELNTIPGFTKISMYPKLWEASGVSYPALMDRLIALAFDRHGQKSKLVRRFGAQA